MCNCRSYNKPEWGGFMAEVVLDPRPFFDSATKTVCVDPCIASTILRLWSRGVWTEGCCCGHNQDYPSVIIASLEMAESAAVVLREDGRTWRVTLFVGAT